MSESSNSEFSIGVLTGGGDCAGLNAAIRAIVRKSTLFGWKILAFRNGWAGVLEGDYFEMTSDHVAGILNQGGTVLGTSRTDPRASKETYARECWS